MLKNGVAYKCTTSINEASNLKSDIESKVHFQNDESK